MKKKRKKQQQQQNKTKKTVLGFWVGSEVAVGWVWSIGVGVSAPETTREVGSTPPPQKKLKDL